MSMISIARIAPRSDGGFDFDNEGERAFVIRVHGFEVEMIDIDQEGVPIEGMVCDVVDLLAWLPDKPETWWLRRGDETPILGARNLTMAAYYGDTITLHQNPQEWLAAGWKGACILNWSWPIARLFHGCGVVECATPELHQRLLKALRRWEPRVLLRQGVRRAA